MCVCVCVRVCECVRACVPACVRAVCDIIFNKPEGGHFTEEEKRVTRAGAIDCARFETRDCFGPVTSTFFTPETGSARQ